MWNEAVTLFRDYWGIGVAVIGFVGSLIYLWLNETRKHIRILFLYLPIVLVVLYFNPLFAELVQRVSGSESYYRILGLLPIASVIAYTCVHIYGRCKGVKQWIFALGMLALIVVSGGYVYGSPNFERAQNLYHVPSSVVEICDSIVVRGREVRAVFPKELLQYVRQYSPTVCMPYGYEVLEQEDSHNGLYDAVEAEVINWVRLAPLAIEAQCHYVILPIEKEMLGDPEDYGIIWYGQLSGYAIYRNTNLELEVPNMADGE